MTAYYNEIDGQKAAWLRELITHDLIAPGDVDERSIHDVRPDDLRGYTQCHWFAGIAVWSYALRLAGWPDNREVWTGSCPCPSFSAAGKGEGFDDARHLWPVWAPLIEKRRPPVVFGEQVEAAIGHGWLDLVSSDLENANYSIGAAVLGACSVGAPHRRQRVYFVAESDQGKRKLESRRGSRFSEAAGGWAHGQLAGRGDLGSVALSSEARYDHAGEHGGGLPLLPARPVECGGVGLMAESLHPERRAEYGHGKDGCHGAHRGRAEAHRESGTCGEVCGVADSQGCDREIPIFERRSFQASLEPGGRGGIGWSSPLNGFWRDADWIFCRDGKWRPVRPGSFPLVTGAPARVVRLRGYGDAINAEVAAAFVRAYMEIDAHRLMPAARGGE